MYDVVGMHTVFQSIPTVLAASLNTRTAGMRESRKICYTNAAIIPSNRIRALHITRRTVRV